MHALPLVAHTNSRLLEDACPRHAAGLLRMLLIILVARLCTCHTRSVGASCHRVYMLRNHPADEFHQLADHLCRDASTPQYVRNAGFAFARTIISREPETCATPTRTRVGYWAS